MAEKPHSSKSIMYVVIAVAILLVVLAVPLSSLGKRSAPAGVASDDADQRIQPVAGFALEKAAPVSSGPRDGATVYKTVCQACHATGAAGSPKAGDKAAWAPRIAKGMDAHCEGHGCAAEERAERLQGDAAARRRRQPERRRSQGCRRASGRHGQVSDFDRCRKGGAVRIPFLFPAARNCPSLVVVTGCGG